VKLLVIEEYTMFVVVAYLHVACSSVVTERVVLVVLAGREAGVASLITVGGVVSGSGAKNMEYTEKLGTVNDRVWREESYTTFVQPVQITPSFKMTGLGVGTP